MANFKASTLRKILAGSLAVLMLTSSYAALPMLSSDSLTSITVNAADTSFTIDSLQYTILSSSDINEVSVTNVIKDSEGNYPTNITIPETVEYEGNSYFVTTIGANAFSSASTSYTLGKPDFAPETITLPNTLKTIEAFAFRSSTVQNLSIPASVTQIKSGAFAFSKTSIIEIKGNLTSLGDSAFDRSEVEEVYFSGSVPAIESNTFFNCHSLRKVILPEGCVSIGYNAFKYCENLESVEIPSTLRYIDNRSSSTDRAFEGCEKLLETVDGGVYAGNALVRTDEATLPEDGILRIREGTTVVAQRAINSSNIKGIVFPSTYTSLSYGSFSNMSIDRLVIPETLMPEGSTEYQYANLYGMSGVDELVIESPIVEMKPFTMSFITSRKLILPGTLKSIQNKAMYSVLADFVEFPEGLETIEDSDNSSSANTFRSLKLPAGLVSIGSYFYNYSNTSYSAKRIQTDSIVMPLSLYNSKPDIADNAFYNTQNVPLFITGSGAIDNNTSYYISKNLGTAYLFIEEGIDTAALDNDGVEYAVFRKDSDNKKISVISATSDFSVPEISDQTDFAFEDDSYSISFENEAAYSYQIVDDSYALVKKYNNTIPGQTINVPSELGGKPVKVIGSNAFSGNTAAQINLPDTVTAISDSAFNDCISITEFTAPESLESIGESAFEGCTALYKITLDNKLKSIGKNAFASCTELIDVAWADISQAELTDIGCFAFQNCSKLIYLNIPSTLSSAGAILGTNSLPDSFLNIVIYDNMADVASKYESNQSWTPSTGTYYKTTEYKPFDSSASPRSIVVLKSDDPDAVLGAKPFGDFNGFYLIEEGVILSDEFKKNNNYFYITRDDNMQTAAFDSTKDHGRQLSSMNTDYTPDYVFINSRPYQLQHSIFKVDEVPSTCTVRGCQEHYEDEFAKCYNSDDNTDDMTEKQLEAIMLPLDYGNHNYDSTTGECMDCHKSFENGIGMITGNSLNVDASIGLNFYFKFDEDFYEENSSSWKDEDGTVHDQAYLRFTYADGSTETQPLNWAERVSTDDGSYQYKFQCPVNAKNMNSTITAELFYGDGTSTGVSQQYSVADYCNYILNEPEKWEESLVMLADAMLNYGSCAQTYFGVDTDKLYTPGEALINYLNDLKNKYSSEYDEEYEQYPYYSPAAKKMQSISSDSIEINHTDTDNVKFAGANLSLESDTVLRLYFEMDDPTGFKMNTSLNSRYYYKEYGTIGKYYYVEYTCSPQIILNNITFYVYTDADGSSNYASVTYNVSSYIQQVLSRPDTPTRTPELKDLMRALYIYSDEAHSYFIEHDTNQYIYP